MSDHIFSQVFAGRRYGAEFWTAAMVMLRRFFLEDQTVGNCDKSEGRIRMRTQLLALFVILLVSATATVAQVSPEVLEIQKMIDEKGLHWTAGQTSMMNLPPEEREQRLGLIVPDDVKAIFRELDEQPPPVLLNPQDIFDWRDYNGVSAVKDQGPCGSCWAFAATGAVESAYMIYTGTEPDLSEQQALSCNTEEGGCDGGWMEYAYDVFASYGAVDESCMPYEADDTVPCTQEQCEPVALILGYENIPNNVNSIKNALLEGPVSTAMTVYPDFYGYNGDCYEHGGFDPVTHAVVIIGWNDNMCGGEGAWICKNSWGDGWGLEGFFYIKFNSCRIGSYAQRPDYNPVHSINPTSFDVCGYYHGDVVYRNLTITNEGSDDLTFYFGPHPRWLSFNPSIGTVPAFNETIVAVGFDPIDYDIGQILTAYPELHISDPVQPLDVIPCTFTILDPNAGYPSIVFDTSPIVLKKYAGDPQDTIVFRRVTNDGGGFLDFQFSSDQVWINAADHGRLKGGRYWDARMRFSSEDLGSGTYTGHVFVEHNDPATVNPLVVDVTMYVYLKTPTKLEIGGIPDDFSLFHNYPNPANPSTTVKFGLPSKSNVRLQVFDVLGRRVAVLADGPMEAGYHEILWDGRNESGGYVSSGIYFYKLQSGEFTSVKKMIILK